MPTLPTPCVKIVLLQNQSRIMSITLKEISVRLKIGRQEETNIQKSKTFILSLIIRIVSIHTIFKRILPRHVNSEWRQSSNPSVPRGRCDKH